MSSYRAEGRKKMNEEIAILEQMAKERGITVKERPYVSSGSTDTLSSESSDDESGEELTDFVIPSATPEQLDRVRKLMESWKSNDRV